MWLQWPEGELASGEDGGRMPRNVSIDQDQKCRYVAQAIPGLAPADAAALAELAYPVRYPSHNVIYHAYHPSFTWYLIGEGTAEAKVVCASRGYSRAWKILGPGDSFGEERWWEDADAICSSEVRTLEESLICLLKTKDLRQFLAERPWALDPLLALFATKLKALERELARSSYGALEERLLNLFRHFARRYGTDLADGGLQIRRPVVQSEVAQLLGVSRRTVSVHMKRLAQEGLIRYEHGCICLYEQTAPSER